ncbi:MAG: NeuD/PglB/VioB family sugar acetyltransferase [Verrucomicrobiaceae bacterium]
MTESNHLRAIPAPLVNPNEPEAQVNTVFIKPGQKLAPGDMICELETTKSNFEVVAEHAGYVVEVLVKRGNRVAAGATICTLADKPGAIPATAANSLPTDTLPDGVKITQPALELARSLGLDLALLPVGPLVTQPMVRELASQGATPATVTPSMVAPQQPFDATAAIIFGGGGHGAMMADTLLPQKTWRIVGVLDDGAAVGTEVVPGVKVIGGRQLLAELQTHGVRLAFNAVAGLDQPKKRLAIFEYLAAEGFGFPAMIHESAHVESSAKIGAGAQIFGGAFVGPLVEIGFGAVVNSGAVVSHHCSIGTCSHIAPGAVLAGTVKVGAGVLIGMGTTVALKLSIGDGVRIGNNARVSADVPAGTIIPSGGSWPKS